MTRQDKIWRAFWFIIAGIYLICVLSLICGCGLQWVPSGQTPPPGARPLSEMALDTLSRADAAGWGDLAQIIGGAVGCGGIVAVGRKALRNRRRRKALEAMNSRQDTALREIVAGVQEALAFKMDKTAASFKDVLGEHQSIDTEKLVSNIRFDIEYDENRN